MTSSGGGGGGGGGGRESDNSAACPLSRAGGARFSGGRKGHSSLDCAYSATTITGGRAARPAIIDHRVRGEDDITTSFYCLPASCLRCCCGPFLCHPPPRSFAGGDASFEQDHLLLVDVCPVRLIGAVGKK